MSFDESVDIDSMLADSPHTMTVSGVTKRCLYDIADVEGEPASYGTSKQMLQVEAISFKTADFPSLTSSSAITVKEYSPAGAEVWSRNYTYRKIQDNGAMTDLYLKRA